MLFALPDSLIQTLLTTYLLKHNVSTDVVSEFPKEIMSYCSGSHNGPQARQCEMCTDPDP